MHSARRLIKYFSLAFAIFLIVSIIQGIYNAGSYFAFKDDKEIIDLDNYKDDYKLLSIDMFKGNIIIEKGDSFLVQSSSNNIEVKQDNNKISLIEKKNNSKETEVVLTIPEALVFDNVIIKNDFGSIKSCVISSSSMDIKIGAGSASFDGLYISSSIIAKLGTGSFDIKSGSLTNLDLDGGIGDVNIKSILNEDSSIKSGIGELNLDLLNDKENYTLELKKSIGEITIDGDVTSSSTIGNGNNKINISSGIGKINISFKKIIER